MNIRAALYAWRDSEARAKNIEGFRVFPNSTLDAIVSALPRTKDELLLVKGIKEAKYNLYGRAILNVIAECITAPKVPEKDPQAFISLNGVMNKSVGVPERPAYSISQFLDILNRELFRITARVRGEVVSVQERGSALYFSVKDTESEAVLSVFMWTSDYKLSGVEIEAGLEVIIEGRAEIYKPTGRLSLRAQTLELVGEGALKKAYDALRKKLELEGLFAPERKRPLAEFPLRIGVITSRQGAVIHDFLNNLGKYGFQVRFLDARVEGVLAVKDIYKAIARMKSEDIEALVIIRGGGSLESLQAFNNEYVVRAIAEFPKPVICAIGHDKDVPLAQLAADFAPSTPTACTTLLNASWQAASGTVESAYQTIFSNYQSALQRRSYDVMKAHRYFEHAFVSLKSSITSAIDGFLHVVPIYERGLKDTRKVMSESGIQTVRIFTKAMEQISEKIKRFGTLLDAHDPMRQLRLGYSILRTSKGVLRSVTSAHRGDTIEAVLADGTLSAQIIKIENHD
jgi:exodeoxyribonuclease VII large subunit